MRIGVTYVFVTLGDSNRKALTGVLLNRSPVTHQLEPKFSETFGSRA